MTRNKKFMKSSDSSQGAVEIPGDLWIEILARVPIDLVVKFRHLSKFHRDLINSPDFKKTHRTSSSRSYVIVDGVWKNDHFLNKSDLTNSDPIQLHRLISLASNGSECIGCCEGILLLLLLQQESQHSSIMLWNPLTGATSPSFPKEPASYLLGHDAVTDDVKILKIPHHVYNEGDYKCEIYSSKSGSWRKKSYDLQMQHMKLERFHYNDKWAVFMDGTNSVHMTGKEADTDEWIVVAYDFSTEEFKRIDLPVELRAAGSLCVSLRSLNGCLCCYPSGMERSDPFSVWMMKEYGVVDSWTRVLSFDRPYSYCLTPIDFVNGGRQIYLLSLRGVHLYDLVEKKLKKPVPFRHPKEFVSCSSCFEYTPSLHNLFNT